MGGDNDLLFRPAADALGSTKAGFLSTSSFARLDAKATLARLRVSGWGGKRWKARVEGLDWVRPLRCESDPGRLSPF